MPRVPMVTTGLPRIGTRPGASNKPPETRQETAYSHARGRGESVRAPGRPSLRLPALSGASRAQEETGRLGRQALRAVAHISTVWTCAHKSGVEVLLDYSRALGGTEKEVPSGRTQPQEHSRSSLGSAAWRAEHRPHFEAPRTSREHLPALRLHQSEQGNLRLRPLGVRTVTHGRIRRGGTQTSRPEHRVHSCRGAGV